MAVNGIGLQGPTRGPAKTPRKIGSPGAPAGGENPQGATGAPPSEGQGGGKAEGEYPQGVSNMLKEVHGLLQKQGGKGLPGFSISSPSPSPQGGMQSQA